MYAGWKKSGGGQVPSYLAPHEEAAGEEKGGGPSARPTPLLNGKLATYYLRCGGTKYAKTVQSRVTAGIVLYPPLYSLPHGVRPGPGAG